MRTATATIRSLMEQVSQGALRLPEIQRSYVWKPAQVAGLVDSLYRRYPSGSILLWETTETVEEKTIATKTGDSPVFVTKPLYLLDGQQRLTSLHRVFTGHEKALVVFNVVTKKFQIESAATKRDKRWVRVHDLVAGTVAPFALVEQLKDDAAELTPEVLHDRLERVRRISDYPYFLEILDDLPYPEVTEVFVRVNSRGRALKDTDLALATLSARWPGVVAKFDELIQDARSRQYNDLDAAFMVRAFAALATGTANPSAFASVPVEKLEAAWPSLVRGVKHTITLLVDELGLDNSKLVPSANALVPLVFYLGTRAEAPLKEEERLSLVYWLLVAFIQARFSASAATVIAQDISALRSDDPFRALFSNLGLLTTRPEITPSMLAGKSSTSPFFLLSYLVVRRASAPDWWYGAPVSLSHDGTYKVEYHHIHPRKRLRSRYSKADINDLANLAFISDKANRKISDREPAKYFPELEGADPSFLGKHLVPTDPELRSVAAYPQLVTARRAMLADAMNQLLEAYRPASLESVTTAVAKEVSQAQVALDAFGTSTEAGDIQLVVQVGLDGETYADSVAYAAFDSMLNDLADGLGAELDFGGEYLTFEAETEPVGLPLGPLTISGSVDEWRKVLDRELGDLRPLDEMPAGEPSPWEGTRDEFSVLDSD